MPLTRAYSLLTIKSVDDEQRVIEGIATTPEADRLGDVIDPSGAIFRLPIPLLWQHNTREPIGQVTAASVTPDGITIQAHIAKGLLPRIDEAWALIKSGLVRGLSIGFAPREKQPIKGSFGVRFASWEWLELSAVTIPANVDASIMTIRSIDAQDLAASGPGLGVNPVHSAGAPAPVVRASKDAVPPMKTITEQIQAFESTRQAKTARMNEIMTAAAEKGETLDETKSQEYDGLQAEVKSVDAHLTRLRDLDATNKVTAVPVQGQTPARAAETRAGVISVQSPLPLGVEFARAVLCKVRAHLTGLSPIDIARGQYPDNPRIEQYLMRGAVPAGTTTDSVWAGALVDPTNLVGEFIEYLRPQTIIGKFGTGAIPSLRRVPFNVRVIGQTSGGEGYWVGQGAPKPLTSFQTADTTLTWAKCAAIAVITEELARFSSPSAESLVRDELARAIIERLDTDFVDPAKVAVSNVSPASITYGLTALTSAGVTADFARTDLQNLLEQFILSNVDPTSLVLIMPNTLALALSVLVNALGQPEFSGLTMRGGTMMGIPVITSQYAANQSGGGNLVIAVNASDIFLADDGQVTVDMSREASLQMLDNPTNNSSTATATTMVSMFQTNSIALRAERYITWAKRQAAAVVYMDDVNWGSIGSPS
jgi:HK97 family phage major capsid protein/HK97 family phage prohead protease